MTTMPLDVEGLLAELDDPRAEPFDVLADGTTMGHVHLKVAAIHDAVAFYRDVLGFALMAQLGPYAAFLSAGGYHHHLGANTWESAAALPPAPGTAALRHATIVLPDRAERDRLIARIEGAGHELQEGSAGPALRDPSGNALVLAIS
jgi:catechol 2,3-dioxygenase